MSRLFMSLTSWAIAVAPAWHQVFSAPLDECDSLRASVDRSLAWAPVARGLDFARIDLDSAYLRDLTLIRYANTAYRARPFDQRDVLRANQRQGYFAPPLYSIKELQRGLRQATLIASAGMTMSYSEPIPAGFLRIDGTTRSPVAPKDRILDGVVCLTTDGSLLILSEIVSGARRAPQRVDGCYSGFQAGPVIVADGAPTAQEHRLKTSRVLLGLAFGDYTVIGYSAMATTAALGCAATAHSLAITSAIGLQGDSLGGIGLGVAFAKIVPVDGLGSTDATIASVLVIEPRGIQKARAQTSLGR